MMNGWTGGQYSLYRAISGVYLLIHFVALLPWFAESATPREAGGLMRRPVS